MVSNDRGGHWKEFEQEENQDMSKVRVLRQQFYMKYNYYLIKWEFLVVVPRLKGGGGWTFVEGNVVG